MATFSGSAADMLKQYGAAVPEQQPMSSLEESQQAKAKMDAEKVCTDSACTEDHAHGHDHGDGKVCTEDHGHAAHDHEESSHDHGHDHHKKPEKSHDHAGHDHAAKEGDHGHGHHEAAEEAPPAAPKFEGCAAGKYNWSGTEGGKTDAADGAVGSRITDYAFGDGPKKASVYVDLDGLDDVADDAMSLVLVSPKKVEFSITIGGEDRKLTLNHIFSEVTAVKILRKPGKNRVVLKLTKEKPEPWSKLIAAPATGFDPEDEAPGGMPGMGGMGGMDMVSICVFARGYSKTPDSLLGEHDGRHGRRRRRHGYVSDQRPPRRVIRAWKFDPVFS